MSSRDQPIIRAATRDDEPALWRMLYLAIFVAPGEPAPEPEIAQRPEVARYVRGWGRDHDDGVVALHGMQVVGAAWLRLWSEDDHGYGYLDGATPEISMAVEPGWRGRGVGTRLLDQLLSRADAAYSATSLSVSPGNPALRLYRRFGFEIVAMANDALTMRRSRIEGGRRPL